MGYELDRLMKQFGVSAPVIAYTSAPVAPQAPVAPSGAADDTGMAYLQSKYDQDNAMYKSNLARYQADSAAYPANKAAQDAYKQQYQSRIANTPQYAQSQFQTQSTMPGGMTTLSPASKRSGPGGFDNQNRVIQDYFKSGPGQTASAETINTRMNELGLVDRDIRNAMGSGFQYGGGQNGYSATTAGAPNARREAFRTWFAANPNPTPEQLQDGKTRFGLTNQDFLDVTGSYWGDTLKPPAYTPPAQGYTYTPPNNGQMGPPVPGTGDVVSTTPYKDWKKGDIGTQGFAEGGSVRMMLPDYSEDGPGVPQRAMPTAPMQAQPVDGLQQLLARYQPATDYGGELRAAREAHGAESQAYYDMLKGMVSNKEGAGPDKSEMYFRLAAALGSPTKTGSIGEVLGNVSQTMAEHQREVRSAQRAAKQQQDALMLQAQQARMGSAKEDLNAVRGLAADEAKGRNATAMEAMKEYFKTGQPQSEAGKQAMDQGYKPGTPEYNEAVKQIIKNNLDSGNLYKQAMLAVAQGNQGIAAGNLGVAQGNLALQQVKTDADLKAKQKLSPTEAKMKKDLEDSIQMHEYMLEQYKSAWKLNDNTFDNSLGGRAKFLALSKMGSKDPKVVKTQEQENTLGSLSADNMKARFGAQFTEKEGELNRNLQGIGAMNLEAKKRIIENNSDAVAARAKELKRQLAEINAGDFRLTTPNAAGGQ